ncbi:exo-beta-N-acetylmuramidase NamZ family protein [Parapedobacter sp. 10938]|uniref:exo-beta-N-acetylmuramidase NamZ family protein n=1 Tax=Parapedobacter flavus TaxID=3110225 RepID=UPI002DB6DDB9|nr:DUF1343 domain-containing protein [Parapedobacter sp. 10938]MEC3880050.1 DUF1343 domain-containing protein [Parapedobacter sp. 10938]
MGFFTTTKNNAKQGWLFALVLLPLVTILACGGNAQQRDSDAADTSGDAGIHTGAEQLDRYLPLLAGKKVGMMGNQTSVVGDRHLVDVLLEKGVDLQFAFAPEHGFRGKIERGEKVSNEVDEETGLPLYSLYGKNEKADSIVAAVDVMLFDLQDVGARFYTYITSMHRVMQLCANNGTKLIVLDRPNPNGDQVDGPVRKDDKFKSNVSYHKIAMIHGLTVGELAKMINGEGWLDGGAQCDLEVITVQNYDHNTPYELPVIPSPSLPNQLSVRLYMSLCLFEGTDISVGRGTDWPFQVLGYPDPVFGDFTFTPGTRPGMAAHVEQQGNECYGLDFRGLDPQEQTFTLKYLIDFYKKAPFKDTFFSRPEFFDKLAGTDELRKQIIAGKSEAEIRESWAADLATYKTMRKQHLLYPDFE